MLRVTEGGARLLQAADTPEVLASSDFLRLLDIPREAVSAKSWHLAGICPENVERLPLTSEASTG